MKSLLNHHDAISPLDSPLVSLCVYRRCYTSPYFLSLEEGQARVNECTAAINEDGVEFAMCFDPCYDKPLFVYSPCMLPSCRLR
jgi:hypothetical protein